MSIDINPTHGDPAKIRYTLRPVPPKARKADETETPYAAHVLVKSASLGAIARQMVREGSKYSEAEIISMMTQMMDTIAYRLTNGETVNLGSMLRLKPAIRGTFATKDAPFDPSQHEIVVTANIGRGLKRIIQHATTERVETSTEPELTQVLPFDTDSSTRKTFAFFVRGYHLSNHPEDTTATWFIRIGDQTLDVQPNFCDNTKAFFSIDRKHLPKGTTFHIGLRLQKTTGTTTEILHPTPITAH